MSTNAASLVGEFEFFRKSMLHENNYRHITDNLRLQLALLQIVKCKESNILLFRAI